MTRISAMLLAVGASVCGWFWQYQKHKRGDGIFNLLGEGLGGWVLHGVFLAVLVALVLAILAGFDRRDNGGRS